MQIRIIIEHKYYSSYRKQICNYREERREGVLVFISIDQERNVARERRRGDRPPSNV